LAFGLIYWAWTLIWVPMVVGPHFAWAFPGYLLLLVLLGGLSGLFGWVTHALHRRVALPLGLALPLAWVAVEWVKAHFPFGLAFPWMGLGLTLTSQPQLLGVAEWVGEAGVAFWLAGVNGLVGSVILGGRSGRGLRPLSMAVATVVVPSVVGVARASTLPLDQGPMITVVGTRVPTGLRRTPGLASEEALRQVREELRGLGRGTADLLVLPEATAPVPLGAPEAVAINQALSSLAERLEMPVVFGGLGGGVGEENGDPPTNSAFLLSPTDTLVQRYDKVRLVPGMEAGRYSKGKAAQLFTAGDWVYGPLVCYESLFSRSARKARTGGAQVLLNLTSDIWFGHGRSLVGALFLQQHPAHLILRAVETRTSVARAANGGFSFLLDPLGQVVTETVPPTGGMTRGRVPVYPGTTFFARTGDWVGPGCILLCFLLLLAVGRQFRGRARGALS
jgi:apolipoprotein N-acyltransferase